MKKCYPQYKTQRYLVIVLLLCIQNNYSAAQENISQIIVGSFINQSLNSESDNGILIDGLNFILARRTYEIAVITDDEEGINGTGFVHKIFLNNKKEHVEHMISSFSLRSYITYNLIYQRTIFEHLFINAGTLTGIYLGKNNNNNNIYSSQDQYQENAYSWNVKLGFGYRF